MDGVLLSGDARTSDGRHTKRAVHVPLLTHGRRGLLDLGHQGQTTPPYRTANGAVPLPPAGKGQPGVNMTTLPLEIAIVTRTRLDGGGAGSDGDPYFGRCPGADTLRAGGAARIA